MLQKFKDGLIFGCGFAISLVIIWNIGSYISLAIFSNSQNVPTSKSVPNVPPARSLNEKVTPFYELPLDQQIAQATFIAIAKYEPSSDGKKKAIISEFLKKDPNSTIYYDIGDELPHSGYIPQEGVFHGDGLVIFFTGSPATQSVSFTYSGDRIGGLGDIPIALFKKKCGTPDA